MPSLCTSLAQVIKSKHYDTIKLEEARQALWESSADRGIDFSLNISSTTRRGMAPLHIAIAEGLYL